MSKICPNCKYPNPDNADECFKCKADISEAAIRERQARERLERERVRQEQNNHRTSQNEQVHQQREAEREINMINRIQVAMYRNNEYFEKAMCSVHNSIFGCYVMIVISCMGAVINILNLNNTENILYYQYIGACVGGAVGFALLLTVFKWMQSNITAQQKTISLLEKIIENENNE